MKVPRLVDVAVLFFWDVSLFFFVSFLDAMARVWIPRPWWSFAGTIEQFYLPLHALARAICKT